MIPTTVNDKRVADNKDASEDREFLLAEAKAVIHSLTDAQKKELLKAAKIILARTAP